MDEFDMHMIAAVEAFKAVDEFSFYRPGDANPSALFGSACDDSIETLADAV